MDENENKNQEIDVVDKAIEAGANQAKNFVAKKAKSWIVAHLPVILQAIGIFLLIIIAAGIINLIPFLIEQTFNKILGFFDPDDPNAEATTTEMQNIIYINDPEDGSGDGEYKLSVEDFAEQILQELENKKVDNEAAGFITEDLEDMIDKYMKAEVQTTYPKTERAKNDLDGIIKIYRASADYEGENQVPKQLKYMKYSTFKNYSDLDVLDYFSIDPESFKLWIAVKDGSATNITKKDFDYQTAIQGYSVPFRFFIILHVFAQDTDFMNDFVDMVLGEGIENPIELTYVESKSVITTETTYSGKVTTEIREEFIKGKEEFIAIEEGLPSVEELYESDVLIDDSNVSSYLSFEPNFKTVQTIYSGKFYVTNADTWIKSSSKDIGQLTTETRPTSGNDEPTNVRNDSSDPTYTMAINSHNFVVNVKKIKHYYIDEITTTTITESKYTVVDGESKIKLTEDEGIIKLINDYPKVKDNLTSAPSNLFYFLQQSENTQTLEKIMRYVLYMLSGTNYGVTEGDLDNLLNDMFNEYGTGGYGNSVEAKVWFALRNAGYSPEAVAGVMGNIYQESKFNPSLEEYGGYGYGLCQWTDTGEEQGAMRRTYLEKYAESKGVAPSDVDTQIEFLITELDLNGEGPAQGYAVRQLYDNNGYTINKWKDADNPEDAAKVFCWIFERPSVPVMSERTRMAREYYEYYTGIGDANELQLVIVDVIKNPDDYEAIEADKNYCLVWTSRVYTVAANAIGAEDPTRSANCASCSGYLYGVSTDFSNIPLGATVYRSSSTQGDSAGYKFGHVGIYIGEGQIAHNANGVYPGQPASICTVEEWLANAESMGASVCWGWQGVPVNENYPITQGLIPTGWGSNNCI